MGHPLRSPSARPEGHRRRHLLLCSERLRHPLQCNLKHVVHARSRQDLELGLDLVADLREVLHVLLGDHDRLDAGPERGQQLLLEAADGQNATAQA